MFKCMKNFSTHVTRFSNCLVDPKSEWYTNSNINRIIDDEGMLIEYNILLLMKKNVKFKL